MKCSACGSEIPAGAKFCTGCGAKCPENVQAAPASAPVSAMPVSAPVGDNRSMSFAQEDQLLKLFLDDKSYWFFESFVSRVCEHTENSVKIKMGCNWFSYWCDYTDAYADVPILRNADGFQLDLANAKYSWKFTVKGWIALVCGILLIWCVAPAAYIALDFLLGHSELEKKLKLRLDIANKNFAVPHCFLLPAQAPYDLSGKTATEIAQIALPNWKSEDLLREEIYRNPNFDQYRLSVAIQKYGKGIRPEDVIFQICRKGANGGNSYLFTTQGVYARIMIGGIIPKSSFLSYNEIIGHKTYGFMTVLCLGSNDRGKSVWYRYFGTAQTTEKHFAQLQDVMDFVKAMQMRRA